MTTEPHTARPAALEALLRHAIDYAGLFPPAQLDMRDAVERYETYLASSDRWALGRFVVPASRLDELAATAASSSGARGQERSLGGAPWRLSVLVGTDVAADADRIRSFDAHHGAAATGWRARVESVELRASTADAIRSGLAAVGDSFERYVEIPVTTDPTPLVQAIGAAGARAKVRTGGTSPEAFPAVEDLVRFLAACVARNVPFKATAGLHHPLRGDYALTYDPGSPRGTMYGFLNVLLAAALLRAGAGEDAARRALVERDPGRVSFDEHGVTYDGRRVSLDDVLAVRESAMTSFGSCSFREPLDDLTRHGLL